MRLLHERVLAAVAIRAITWNYASNGLEGQITNFS